MKDIVQRTVTVFTLIFSILSIAPAIAQQKLTDNSPFIGSWRLVSVIRHILPAGPSINSFGTNPQGYLNYSSDGHMMTIIVKSNRPRPKGQVATTAEAEALYRSMNSYAGTYTIYRDRIIHHVLISWNEKWTGQDEIRYYKLQGKYLILSMPPIRDPATKKWAIDSLTWEKIN